MLCKNISTDNLPQKGQSAVLSLDYVTAQVPCFEYTPTNLDTIAASYPQSIIVELGQVIEYVSSRIPPGLHVDFVELAEKACRLYGDYSEFFSITDEVLDGYDYDAFMRAISQSQNTSNEAREHDPLMQEMANSMFAVYAQAIEYYVMEVMHILAAYLCPTFVNTGCIYIPDAFISNSTALVLKLNLEER